MKPFELYNEEKNLYPIVISLPHSGTWLPAEMRDRLRSDAILANTDWFLPELYQFLIVQGCTVIENRVNRYVVDPNRESRMQGADYQNTVVYQQNTFGNDLYDERLPKQVVDQRLENYYWPYHRKLQELIDQKKTHFPKVYLIDLHSFAEYPNSDEASVPADFVIGNQADQTSSSELRHSLTRFLEDEGYRVSNNEPFRGGYITRHYGEKADVEAMQVEIRYNQYIEQRSFGEEELTKYDSALFFTAQQKLSRVFEKLIRGIS